MAKAPPQGQQVAAVKRSPLDYPPENWQAQLGQVVGGGGVGLALPCVMSTTTGANYMTASSVSR